jgi:hypothetical protein
MELTDESRTLTELTDDSRSVAELTCCKDTDGTDR